MYSLASTSQIRAPSARSTKNGSRPRPRKARTGELTPPGMRFRASANNCEEREAMLAANVQRPTANVQRPIEPARPRAGGVDNPNGLRAGRLHVSIAAALTSRFAAPTLPFALKGGVAKW